MLNRNRQGSAMVLAIIAFIVLAGIGAAFFSVSLARQSVTSVASSSDSALHIAEAGVDDAINKLNAYANYSGTVPTSADFACIGISLTASDGTTYNQVTGTVNGGSYTVTISPAYSIKQTYKITSVATKNTEKRAIECYVSPAPDGPVFDYGLFGDVVVDAGGDVVSDGYKSTSGTYSSQVSTHTHNGKDYEYANPTGHIGSNGDVDVGGGSTIFGNATPGPTGSIDTSNGAFVLGSTSQATSTMALSTPTYNPPSSGATTSLPSGVTVGSGADKHKEIYMTDSVYHLNKIDTQPSEWLVITSPVTIYVDGDMNVQGNFQLKGDAAKVTIYHKSGDIKINAQSIVNAAGVAVEGTPSEFQIYSQTTDDVTINGGAGVYAAIYTPLATYTNNGGAAVYGAVVAKTIKITGSATFHYDEDINLTPTTTYIYKIKSWKEYIP
jgi:Tfp pilus assembly protein PilX